MTLAEVLTHLPLHHLHVLWKDIFPLSLCKPLTIAQKQNRFENKYCSNVESMTTLVEYDRDYYVCLIFQKLRQVLKFKCRTYCLIPATNDEIRSQLEKNV